MMTATYIKEILPYLGKVADDRNAELLQLFTGADAGQQEQLRRTDRPSRQNDFLASANDVLRSSFTFADLNAYCGRTFRLVG